MSDSAAVVRLRTSSHQSDRESLEMRRVDECFSRTAADGAPTVLRSPAPDALPVREQIAVSMRDR